MFLFLPCLPPCVVSTLHPPYVVSSLHLCIRLLTFYFILTSPISRALCFDLISAVLLSFYCLSFPLVRCQSCCCQWLCWVCALQDFQCSLAFYRFSFIPFSPWFFPSCCQNKSSYLFIFNCLLLHPVLGPFLLYIPHRLHHDVFHCNKI